MFSKYLKNLILITLCINSVRAMEEREKRPRSFSSLPFPALTESEKRLVTNSPRVQQRFTLESLPTELKMLIAQFLVSIPNNILDIRNFTANLRRLARVNKEFYNIINDLNFTKYLISFLNKIRSKDDKIKKSVTMPTGSDWGKQALKGNFRFQLDKVLINEELDNEIKQAYLIRTSGAIEWLKAQEIDQSSKIRTLLDQFLTEAIKDNDIKKVYFALLVTIAIDNKTEISKVDNLIESAFITRNQSVIEWLQNIMYQNSLSCNMQTLLSGYLINAVKMNDGSRVSFALELNRNESLSFQKTSEARQLTFKSNLFIDRDNALIVAVNLGYTEILEILLRAGANVNQQGNQKKTALMVACDRGFKDIVEILIKASKEITDVNAKDQHGYTALMSVCDKGYEEIAEILVGAGADLNEIDEWGRTALILAAGCRHTNVVKLLLENGANISIKDNEGNTALKIAKKAGYKEIVKLIESKNSLRSKISKKFGKNK